MFLCAEISPSIKSVRKLNTTNEQIHLDLTVVRRHESEALGSHECVPYIDSRYTHQRVTALWYLRGLG